MYYGESKTISDLILNFMETHSHPFNQTLNLFFGYLPSSGRSRHFFFLSFARSVYCMQHKTRRCFLSLAEHV